MADHAIAHTTGIEAGGPETLEALTEDRFAMWNGFTSAAFWVVVFIVLLLIGMGFFLT
jgi:hypothetical protein